MLSATDQSGCYYMSKYLTLSGLSHFLDKIKGIFVHAAEGTTEGHVVTFGADGKTVIDSGHTIATDVPENAVFTDTTYEVASSTKDGLLSSENFDKLDAIADGAQVNVIESVKVNGTAVEISDKSVDIDLSGYATKTDISTVYRYKGTVNTYAELPKTAEVGDTYNITTADKTHNVKAGDNLAWNGTDWDNLSGIVEIDISDISNDEIDTLFA